MLHICPAFIYLCIFIALLMYLYCLVFWLNHGFWTDKRGFESYWHFIILLIRRQENYVQVTSFPINVTLQIKFRRQFSPRIRTALAPRLKFLAVLNLEGFP